MGLSYINHGSPLSPLAVGPLNYLVSKQSLGPYFGVGPNQLSTSFIGLRGKQEIADGLYAVFNLQSQFDPASGQLSNGIGSVQQNNGLGLARRTGTAIHPRRARRSTARPMRVSVRQSTVH